MNIRNAILAAATHIGSYPDEFRFTEVGIPGRASCGTPGCALGWIGTFAGMPAARRGFGSVSIDVLGIHHHEFYTRMDGLADAGHYRMAWQDSAEDCAQRLRKYADKYHPAKPIQQPPNWQAMAAVQTVDADAISEDARA